MKYTCTMCRTECESQWSEAEAIAEKERDFGSVPLDQCDIVCDLCYQQISPQNNPDYYADYQSAMAAHPDAKPLCFNTPLPTTLMLEDTETIRAYVDAELTRALTEWFDQQEAEILFGTLPK
jgi:hypothetical protein